MSDEDHVNATSDLPTSEVSPTQQVSTVVQDVRALIDAELKYFRLRLDYSRQVLQRGLLFGGVALLAFVGAVIALVFGLVLTLAPILGPGLATLTVTVTLVIIGSIFGMQARNWVKKVSFPEIERNDDDSA